MYPLHNIQPIPLGVLCSKWDWLYMHPLHTIHVGVPGQYTCIPCTIHMYSQSHLGCVAQIHDNTIFMTTPYSWWHHIRDNIIHHTQYSQSHLEWHFRLLLQNSKLKAQSSKLKAPTSPITDTWQKRRSSFELWAFENVTPRGIGCIGTYSWEKEPCKRDDILQKRSIILRSLLIVATPYNHNCTRSVTQLCTWIPCFSIEAL